MQFITEAYVATDPGRIFGALLAATKARFPASLAGHYRVKDIAATLAEFVNAGAVDWNAEYARLIKTNPKMAIVPLDALALPLVEAFYCAVRLTPKWEWIAEGAPLGLQNLIAAKAAENNNLQAAEAEWKLRQDQKKEMERLRAENKVLRSALQATADKLKDREAMLEQEQYKLKHSQAMLEQEQYKRERLDKCKNDHIDRLRSIIAEDRRQLQVRQDTIDVLRGKFCESDVAQLWWCVQSSSIDSCTCLCSGMLREFGARGMNGAISLCLAFIITPGARLNALVAQVELARGDLLLVARVALEAPVPAPALHVAMLTLDAGQSVASRAFFWEIRGAEAGVTPRTLALLAASVPGTDVATLDARSAAVLGNVGFAALFARVVEPRACTAEAHQRAALAVIAAGARDAVLLDLELGVEFLVLREAQWLAAIRALALLGLDTRGFSVPS